MEKLDIVHESIVGLMMHKDIAKVHRVSVATVGMLVSKAKRKPKFIQELFIKEDIQRFKQDKVESVVQGMVEANEFIDSFKTVATKVGALDDRDFLS